MWLVYWFLIFVIIIFFFLMFMIVIIIMWLMDFWGVCYMIVICWRVGIGWGFYWICLILFFFICIVEFIFLFGWMVRKINIYLVNFIIYVVNWLLFNINGLELKRMNCLEFYFVFLLYKKLNMVYFVWCVFWYIVLNFNVFIINDDYLFLFYNKSLWF